MTDETRSKSPWLPNLVGGISIWKLARDLNEPQFFDGRLLVPETEGTDALPTTVRWDVTDLVPLPMARAKYPAEVDGAIRDFVARLEKVGAELSNEASGYHKFKQAFTVPGLDADGGAYYFYDERTKKLCLINWGASPRSIAGQQEFIFGWGNFGKVVETAGPLGAAGAAALAASAASAAQVGPAKAVTPGKDDAEKKKGEEEKKKDEEEKKAAAGGRAWWVWLLVVLAILALAALLLFLFKDCNPAVSYPEGGADGAASLEAGVDGASDGATGDAVADGALADGSLDGGDAGDAGDGGDAADASKDGSSDAADASKDGAADAVADAPGDAKGDAKGPGNGTGTGGPGNGTGTGGPGNGTGPGGTGPGGGIIIGPGGTQLPHLFHSRSDAVHWRITAGQSQLDPSSPLDGAGQTFEVILKPEGSFDKVKVQWQDQSGKWHE